MPVRLHIGTPVSLSVATVTPALVPTAPSSAPMAKIYNSAASLIETVKLPIFDSSQNLFGKRHLLSASYSAGRYMVIYQWTISAVTYQSAEVFDVLGGGDADGQVIGMEYVALPTGRHVIYETETGKLVSGRNPKA